MKLKLGLDRIKNLSQELESGFTIYINYDTGEIKTILALFNAIGNEESFWKKESEEVDSWENSAKISPPSSYEGFQLMESFLKKINDPVFQMELSEYLQKRSSYTDFRSVVENSKYREDWSQYKNEFFIQYLINELRNIDIGFEED